MKIAVRGSPRKPKPKHIAALTATYHPDGRYSYAQCHGCGAHVGGHLPRLFQHTDAHGARIVGVYDDFAQELTVYQRPPR